MNMNTTAITSNKNTTLKEFKRIFGTHLIPKRYNVKDVKLIVSCLEYVKKQPKVFQETYVSSYTHDCAHAYNGQGNQMSCSKGTIERLVTSLTPAAIAVESSNKNTYNSNNYEELINIIQNKPPTIKELINQYAEECSRNETINSDAKLIECVKNKIRDNHTELFTNNVSREINEYIPQLIEHRYTIGHVKYNSGTNETEVIFGGQPALFSYSITNLVFECWRRRPLISSHLQSK
jgi:hypothetical protein